MGAGTTIALIKALAPKADPAVIEQAVSDWLDDHPEATTTVEDGSITKAKLVEALQNIINGSGVCIDELNLQGTIKKPSFWCYKINRIQN